MVELVNKREKRVVIREHVYEQPEGLRCVYIHERNRVAYTMTLNLLSTDSSLVFLRWYPEAETSVHFGESVEEYKTTRVECELPIDSTAISEAEMEKWLKYLISGCERRFKPCPYKDPCKGVTERHEAKERIRELQRVMPTHTQQAAQLNTPEAGDAKDDPQKKAA